MFHCDAHGFKDPTFPCPACFPMEKNSQLVLGLRHGEALVLNEQVTIEIETPHNTQTKVRVRAPKAVRITRRKMT